MKILLTITLLTLTFFTAAAQKRSLPSEEDIATAKKLKTEFPEQDVVMLDRVVEVSFRKNSKKTGIEVYVKNKVNFLNISENATIQHPVFYDTESEVNKFRIKDKTGRDIPYTANRIKDEYLNSNDLFHTDYRVKYIPLVFPLQGVRFVIETEKKYNDIKYFTNEYFTSPYPIIAGKLIVTIPNWLEIDLKEFNFNNVDISKKETKTEDVKTITFAYKNASPQIADNNSPGPSHLYPHVLFIAKSYNDQSSKHSLFSNVSDLYAWYNDLAQRVEIDPSVYAKKVAELTKGGLTDIDKAKNIFYWVQDNIRYIAFEDGIAGFQPDSPQNVFTKRYGDCKGMAILTKSMLIEAGLDAHLVWIGTDRLAYDYSIPSLAVDNHMICAVQLEGKTIFLDGTEQYNRIGDYASRIQNKQALLQDGDHYQILTIPAAPDNFNLEKTTYNFSINNEHLTGVANRLFKGECRVEFQNIYSSLGKGNQNEILPKYLSGGNDNLYVTEITPFKEEERDEDLNISYTVNLKSSVSEFDGTMYIDIDPVKYANDFIFEDRKVDYLSRMKKNKSTEVQLEIPEGYKVGELPDNFSVTTDFFNINVNYAVEGSKISFKKNINFKKRWVKKNNFDMWNKAFLDLKENLTQQIILVKQ